MRRSQSTRHHNARPSSLALPVDDLGVLKETDESNDELSEKNKEINKLKNSVFCLQEQLEKRPTQDNVDALQKELDNLDLILKGTQRENERSMAELERVKAREKLLERELTRLAGDNWQANLEIPYSSSRPARPKSAGLNLLHHRSNTLSSPMISNVPSPRPGSAASFHVQPQSQSQPYSNSISNFYTTPHPDDQQAQQQNAELLDQEQLQQREAHRLATLAQIEQVRMLILGMDQKLTVREENLSKMVQRAKDEGRKYDAAAAAAASAVKVV